MVVVMMTTVVAVTGFAMCNSLQNQHSPLEPKPDTCCPECHPRRQH